MRGDEWKRGEQEVQPASGIPKFGKKGMAWFARSLLAALRAMEQKEPDKLKGLSLEAVVAEYVAVEQQCIATYSSGYVSWVDDESYRGKGDAFGVWQIDYDLVKHDLRETVADLVRIRARDLDAERHTTLDAWLEADRAGTLAHAGEQGGAEGMPDELRAPVLAAAAVRRRRKDCPCGRRFVAERWNAVRCPDCIAVMRAERQRQPRRTR